MNGVDLDDFPNADFYYKMVAKVEGKFYSIYDAKYQYEVGKIKSEKAKPGKKGGFYVYKQAKSAIFADIIFHPGGFFTAPRTILKCICWGDEPLKYGNGKLCFSNIMPVGDMGLPIGYKANPRECIQQMIKDKEFRTFLRLERTFDLGLIRRNNFCLERYENNTFEAYFSESVVKNIEKLLLQDREEEEMAAHYDEDQQQNNAEPERPITREE